MSETSFDRLQEAPLRDAWPNEARNFTPWLASNLDRIAEAIGMPLELVGSEVAVTNFSADILARNPENESLVLIENQLEEGDHNHLGQILTYLAGLEAHTVVWVASTFREAHLSAVRWLNEHTIEPYAFFALKVRVVRIGMSPFAPLFEVIERPNHWDRQIQEATRERRDVSAINELRGRFWDHFLHRHPSEAKVAKRYAVSSRWRPLPGLDLNIARYISKSGVGIFVRGARGVAPETTEIRLVPIAAKLEDRLGVPLNEGSDNFFFLKSLRLDTGDEDNWDKASDWLQVETERYVSALQDLLGQM
jgi:hypothetical protein